MPPSAPAEVPPSTVSSLKTILCLERRALMVGILITGYRMTGAFAFVPRGIADSFHRIYLNVPLIVLFIAHSLISIRISYMGNHGQSALLDIAFLVAAAVRGDFRARPFSLLERGCDPPAQGVIEK